MKKHLIAAAVAGAFAVPAMAQVTVSGLLDAALIMNDKDSSTTAAGVTTSTKLSETGMTSARGWGTSELRFSGTEDLGGGLRASFQLNSDLRATALGNAFFTSRDRWVALSGGFGTIRLGSQGNVGNSAGFNAYNQLGTTAIGSNYGRLIQGGIERQNNVVNYISPAINGITLHAGTALNSSDSDAAASVGKNATSQNSFSITYAAGPLSAGAGMTERKVKVEAAAAGTANTTGIGAPGAAAVARAETEVKANFIGASYNLGVATLGGSIAKNKSSNELTGANTRDLTLNTVGVTVPLGAATVRATAFTGKDKVSTAATDDLKESGHQLSVTYALSKRTLVYAFLGQTEIKRSAGNTTSANTKVTGHRIGVTHSF